jgi:hypothetical protein
MNNHPTALQKFERIMGLTSHSAKYRRNETILGLAFLGLYFLGQVLPDAFGRHPTSFQKTIEGLAVIPGLIGFLGVPLLFAGVPGWVFMKAQRSNRSLFYSRPFTIAALAVVILAHLLVFALGTPFFFVPTGTGIRPMGWPFMLMFVCFLAFLLIVPISICAIIKERPRLVGVLCLAGWITPFFFGIFLLRIAAKIMGFDLED